MRRSYMCLIYSYAVLPIQVVHKGPPTGSRVVAHGVPIYSYSPQSSCMLLKKVHLVLLVFAIAFFTLAACSDDPSPTGAETNPDPESEEVEVSMTGIVAVEETDEAIEGADVSVFREEGQTALDTFTTRTDGSYNLAFTVSTENIPDGLRVETKADGFQDDKATLAFSTEIEFDISLASETPVKVVFSGEITDTSNDEPITNAIVRGSRTDTGDELFEVESNFSGAYEAAVEFSEVPSEVLVEAEADGFESSQKTVAFDKELTVNLELEPIPRIQTIAAFVSSQGNFSDANGTVTAYDPAEETATTAIAPAANIQSIGILKDRLFLMAGDRVDVHDVQSFDQVGQISGVTNARYIVFGTSDLALVTNIKQFDGNFDVVAPASADLVNVHTYEVLDTAELTDNPAGMAVAQNLVLVAQGGFGSSEAIAMVRPNTQTGQLTVEGSIDAGCAVTFLFTLSDTEISGLCNTTDDEGQYIVIDVATQEVITRTDLGGRVTTSTGAGQDGVLASDLPAVFAVLDANRIVQLDPMTGAVEAEIGPLAGNPIGGVSFDEIDERLYVARPVGDFQTPGEVSIHELDGTEVGRFDAGIAPSHIVFSRALR